MVESTCTSADVHWSYGRHNSSAALTGYRMSLRLQPSSHRGATRLGLLLLLVPLGLILIAGLVVVIWWQSFKGTPEYSVSLLVDAAQRNDDVAFNRVFDVDQVVENFVVDTTRRATSSPELADALGMFKPVSSLASETIRPVVRERAQARIKEISASSARMPFFLKALGIRFGSDVKTDDKKARVTIKHGDQTFEMSLAPDGDHWKVISVNDDALAAQVVSDLAGSLRNATPDIQKRVTDGLPEIQKLLP